MSKFKLLCPSCGEDYGDIFSVVLKNEKGIDCVEITFICTNCGYMDEEMQYLYKKVIFKNLGFATCIAFEYFNENNILYRHRR